MLKHKDKILRMCGIIFLTGLIIIVLLSALMFLMPRPFLKIAANALIAENNPQKSDVILVIGGFENTDRLEYAAELFNAGYADKILVSGAGSISQIERRMTNFKVDLKKVIIEDKSTSTYENATFTLPIVKKENYKSIVLVTSPDQSKRALNIFKKVYKGSEISISSAYYNDSEFNPDNILGNKEGMTQLSTEWAKTIYYDLKYMFI